MRTNTWTNADGLVVGFGRANTRNPEAGVIETKGNLRQVELEVYYDMDAATANVKSAVIPAGAVITAATITVSEAFVGGTSISVGTIGTDGTAADADAIDTALTAALTKDAVLVADGAAIGAVVGADVNLTFATTGTFTAGRASVFLEYIMPSAK